VRVLLDSNILIASIVLNGKTTNKVLQHIISTDEFELVLSDTIIDETRKVVEARWKNSLEYFEDFIKDIKFHYLRLCAGDKVVNIRDPKDKHVIASALEAEIDLLITGDKDFFEYEYDFEVITPSGYIAKYIDFSAN